MQNWSKQHQRVMMNNPNKLRQLGISGKAKRNWKPKGLEKRSIAYDTENDGGDEDDQEGRKRDGAGRCTLGAGDGR
ncbi:unnamed protein product [Dimorphilus gyrociliatus]|uniref:Uncharacterized protein n=1 Tax=Dimorphilus gyrociliatus TaxID=2664684 RepID=A0A7I8WBB6_9ANNE|nr:unnamed protein product [Dimorphilus gyrociliatus]